MYFHEVENLAIIVVLNSNYIELVLLTDVGENSTPSKALSLYGNGRRVAGAKVWEFR